MPIFRCIFLRLILVESKSFIPGLGLFHLIIKSLMTDLQIYSLQLSIDDDGDDDELMMMMKRVV